MQKNKRKNKRDEEKKIKPDRTLIIPYIARLGEQISRIAKKISISTAFTSKSTMRNKLVHFKLKSRQPKRWFIKYRANVETHILVKQDAR
jgi:hypothetical protein